MTILSIDVGRTSTKACFARDADRVALIPANVARLDLARQGGVDAHLSDPLSDIWMEYQGQGYALGQLAADYGASLGVGQSKVEDLAVKVLGCAGYLGLEGSLAIALGLPYLSQDQFEREKLHAVRSLQSPHIFYYRGKRVDLDVKEVWVVPEGYGSFVWSGVAGGEANSFAELSVAVVDIGHQTTDFLTIDRFRFARGASQSEPFAMSEFYERLAKNIPNADSQSLELIEAVHRPPGKRIFRPRGERQSTDLDQLLPNLVRSFVRDLVERLIAWLPERVTDVVVTGGGGEFCWTDLQATLTEAGLTAHLAAPSRKANALGQLVYAELQSRKAKAR